MLAFAKPDLGSAVVLPPFRDSRASQHKTRKLQGSDARWTGWSCHHFEIIIRSFHWMREVGQSLNHVKISWSQELGIHSPPVGLSLLEQRLVKHSVLHACVFLRTPSHC